MKTKTPQPLTPIIPSPPLPKGPLPSIDEKAKTVGFADLFVGVRFAGVHGENDGVLVVNQFTEQVPGNVERLEQSLKGE